MGAAQEEFVLKDVAQPAQALADGRLREAKFASDIKGFAMAQEAKEDQKQSQVQSPELRCA